jgi:hypothetical protein
MSYIIFFTGQKTGRFIASTKRNFYTGSLQNRQINVLLAVRVISVGCTTISAANCHNTHAIYQVPPEDEQVMLETRTGP